MKKTNSILDFITSHSSVRHFTDQDVSPEDEAAIIAAARMASTSCNYQAYCFISVRDEATKKMLSDISAGAVAAKRAPLLLVVCVDQYKLDLVARKSGVEYWQSEFLDSFIVGVVDAALAAQNAALAAESLGYGICYLGSIRSAMKELRERLNLPDRVFPLFALAVGVPAKKHPVKPRLPMEGIWFREQYDREALERAVDAYDGTMAASGVYEGRHYSLEGCRVRPEADKVEDGTYGWIEHSARRLSSENPLDTRPELREILEKAGFSFK